MIEDKKKKNEDLAKSSIIFLVLFFSNKVMITTQNVSLNNRVASLLVPNVPN